MSTLSKSMTKRDAEKLVGKNITSNRWMNARRHGQQYGVGMPNSQQKIVHHNVTLYSTIYQDVAEYDRAENPRCQVISQE